MCFIYNARLSSQSGHSRSLSSGLLLLRLLLLLLAGRVPLLGHALQAGRQVLTAIQIDAKAAMLATAVPRVVLQQARQVEGARLNMQLGRRPGDTRRAQCTAATHQLHTTGTKRKEHLAKHSMHGVRSVRSAPGPEHPASRRNPPVAS